MKADMARQVVWNSRSVAQSVVSNVTAYVVREGFRKLVIQMLMNLLTLNSLFAILRLVDLFAKYFLYCYEHSLWCFPRWLWSPSYCH